MLVILSVVWVTIPFTLFPLAEEHINSAVTGMLNGGAVLRRSDRRPVLPPAARPQRLGILVGFIGVVFVSLGSSGGGGSAAIGVAMVLLATFFYGLASNLATPISQKYGSLVVTSDARPRRHLDGALRHLGPHRQRVRLVLGRGHRRARRARHRPRLRPDGHADRQGRRPPGVVHHLPHPGRGLFLGATFRDDEIAPIALAGVVLVVGGAVLAGRREA